jgi:hypothetical protein
MSRGLGYVQRAILELIQHEPNGAWAISDLCLSIYDTVTKAQRVAVGRALSRMTLPGTWAVHWINGQSWLYDSCNLAGVRAAHPGWHEDRLKPGGMLYEAVEKAKRFRDASPLQRIDIQIKDQQQKLVMLKQFGALSPEYAATCQRQIQELQQQKAALAERLAS